MRNSVELYNILRPYLRLATHPGSGDQWRSGGLYRGKKAFRVECTHLYLWGSFYAVIKWNPKEPTEQDILRSHGRPTYEQFCKWYNLPLEE